MTKVIRSERIRLLAYLGLTLLALVLLAAGISSLQFQKGDFPFEPPEPENVEEGFPDETTIVNLRPIAIPVSFNSGWLVIIAPIAIYAAYRSREIRAGLLLALIFIGIYLVAFNGLYRNYYEPPESDETEFEQANILPEPTPGESFEDPPDLIDWVSAATTAGIIVIAAVGIVLLWRNREKFLNRKPPLEIISDEAEATLAEIRAGANLRDAVMQCYYDMSQALKKGRGLERQEGMTPREFEEVLERAGIPDRSVRRLTRLFEMVRYGGQIASERDKLEAIDCLQAIVQAAGPQMKHPSADHL
jgi:hypothetical protein